MVSLPDSRIEKSDLQMLAGYISTLRTNVGGVVTSWLVHLSLNRVVWVAAPARDVVLCSWARHFTLMVPLSRAVNKGRNP